MSKKSLSSEPKQKAKKLKLKKETIKDLDAGDKAAQAKGGGVIKAVPASAKPTTLC